MIRKMENNNIDKIMEIWLKTNIEAHNFINKEYWEENFNLVKNEYLPVSETFIFEENDIIKGFISILNKDFIGALFIDLKYQNQGIGKILVDYCKDLYKELSLSVYKENVKATNFYLKNDFKIISEELETSSNKLEYKMNWEK